MEDRKLLYDGLGFVINDSEYTIIKTVLDGDDS
jgi:predicted AAA+ superfamily ATPase